MSTLVWLTRGLAESLPAPLPSPWPKTKSASCPLFSKGPWSSHPGRPYGTWQQYHILLKIYSSFFFLNMEKLFRHKDLNRPVWCPWIVLNHWVPPAFQPTPTPQICLPLLHVKQPSSNDISLTYISLTISLSIYIIYIYIYFLSILYTYRILML